MFLILEEIIINLNLKSGMRYATRPDHSGTVLPSPGWKQKKNREKKETKKEKQKKKKEKEIKRGWES